MAEDEEAMMNRQVSFKHPEWAAQVGGCMFTPENAKDYRESCSSEILAVNDRLQGFFLGILMQRVCPEWAEVWMQNHDLPTINYGLDAIAGIMRAAPKPE